MTPSYSPVAVEKIMKMMVTRASVVIPILQIDSMYIKRLELYLDMPPVYLTDKLIMIYITSLWATKRIINAKHILKIEL